MWPEAPEKKIECPSRRQLRRLNLLRAYKLEKGFQNLHTGNKWEKVVVESARNIRNPAMYNT